MAELEVEACRYLYHLWGKGYLRTCLRAAVSALRALEEMGWLLNFVGGRVWRCAKWASSGPVTHPYTGLDELRTFALACSTKAQWMVCGLAVLSYTCLLGVGVAAPLRGPLACMPLGLRGLVATESPHHDEREECRSLQAEVCHTDRGRQSGGIHQRSHALLCIPNLRRTRWGSHLTPWNPGPRLRDPPRWGSVALRWLGLPVRWLAWWGRRLCE